MKRTKEIAIIGMYTALLIGAQLVLFAVSGIEVVTILFCCFCYRFGVKKGVLLAIAFSLLRCIVFGFIVNVVILYLIYYPLLAIVFGVVGKKLTKEITIKKVIIVSVIAFIMTILFTLIDDILTPLIYLYNIKMFKAYFVASLLTLIPHAITTLIIFLLLFYPIVKLLYKIKI